MTVRRITIFIYLPNEAVAVPAGIFTHDDGHWPRYAVGARSMKNV